MFGYAGTSEADVAALHAGLKRACADDPMLCGIVPGCSRHSHGWGYVIHAANGLFHYRSAKSVYDDDVVLPKLEGEIRAIFHGRFATNQGLMGHIFCHPFTAATDREVIYFAHNGSVKPDHLPERKVDSEWALEQIVKAGSVEAALPKLQGSTLAALNLLILTIDRNTPNFSTLRALNYFNAREEKAKADYYTMFQGNMPGGRAIVSSTFTLDGARVEGLKVGGAAAFGELLTLAP
jgi:glutamine amidotransferase